MDDEDEFMRRAGPQVIELNEEQWADFMYNMTHPKPPTEKMIAAAKMMRELARRPGDLEYESWGKK